MLICVVFVAWVYRRDAKVHPYPGFGLWIATLWLMRCASRTIDFWFGGGESSRIDPLFLLALMILGVVTLIRRPCNWSRIFGHNSGLFLFYGYLCLSVVWSESTENPVVKIMRPIGDLIMALVIATEPSPREAIATAFRRTAILLIPLSIVLIRYFPQLGRGQDKHWGADPWIGVTTHKNPLGQLCIVSAIAFILSLIEARKSGSRILSQRLSLLYIAFTAYLLYGGGNEGSQSSTAMLCLLIGAGLLFAFGKMGDRVDVLVRRIVIGIVVAVGISGTLAVFGTSPQAVVAEAFGKNANLSDRTYLWRDVVRIGMENPILGSGYGGFWIPSVYTKLSPEVDNSPAEAHNGYLETFANLGLVGVGLLAVVILQSLKSATSTIESDFDYGRLRLSLLFMVVVMNYSEATFPRGTHLWWFGFLIVAVYAKPWVSHPEPLVEVENHMRADTRSAVLT